MGNCQCQKLDDSHITRDPMGSESPATATSGSTDPSWSSVGSPYTEKMQERNIRRKADLDACKARVHELEMKVAAAEAEFAALEAAKATAVANIDRDRSSLEASKRDRKTRMDDLRAFLAKTFSAPAFSKSEECAECLANQENDPLNDPSFGVLSKRRHHCRSCGRSLCDEHCAKKHDLPVYGIKEEVRVCEHCWNALEFGETLKVEMMPLKRDEEPEASIRWIDKAAKLGYPRPEMAALVNGICDSQEKMARLERAIRDAEARCSECAAVLEMKVQACSSLGSELQRAQGRIAVLERKLGRLQEASSASERGSVTSDGSGSLSHSPQSRELTSGRSGPRGSPLDGLAATQQSLMESGRRLPLRPVTPNMLIPAEEPQPDSHTAAASGQTISPRCVSWYEAGSTLHQPVVYPEWVELALVMGYSSEVVNQVVQQLMASPPHEHTFERFVDLLDDMCPSAVPKRQSHELRQSIRSLEDQRGDLTQLVERTRARMAPRTSQDLLLCNICYQNKVAIVFKCGHLKCEQCANKICEEAGSKCPDCRATLASPRRAYIGT